MSLVFILQGHSFNSQSTCTSFPVLDLAMGLAKASPCLLPVALVFSQAAQISLTVSL